MTGRIAARIAQWPHTRLASAIIVITIGVGLAWWRAWICDDAFISIRYAQNLVDGNGLVFNQGERVEGFTNFLWTMWLAVGLLVGAPIVGWAIVSGIVLHALTLGMLAWRRAGKLPIAAVLLAVHPDAAIWATGGLENSLFAALAVGAFVAKPPLLRGVLAGGVFLTRPDGALIVVALALTQPRILLTAVPICVGFVAFRLGYYGEWVPNTYYAKSANLTWWSQGLVYLALFAKTTWPLYAGALSAFVRRPTREVVLASVFVLLWTVYVTRVGGDFMHARLLVATLPFLALLAETGLDHLPPARRLIAAGALVVTLLATPYPLGGHGHRSGITSEWHFYTQIRADWLDSSRTRGLTLRRYLDKLDVRVVFIGSEANLVYHSGARTALECETGLTDRTIAHQTLTKRGRVGHEKRAPVEYMLTADLALNPAFQTHPEFDALIPRISVDLGGVTVRLLRWNAPLIEALRARGATVPDVPAMLDASLASFRALPPAQRAAQLAQLTRFYFSQVPDQVREDRYRAAASP